MASYLLYAFSMSLNYILEEYPPKSKSKWVVFECILGDVYLGDQYTDKGTAKLYPGR
jgi:hypothetical protein